ncbi:putative olfactory receptor 2W6 [Urocitellus parryii]
MTILGNFSIILLSFMDPSLNTTMYFFLINLFFLDLCFISASVPKILSHLWGPDKCITYIGYVIKWCVFLCIGAMEGMLLVEMTFDHYVALPSTISHHPLDGFLCEVSVLIYLAYEDTTTNEWQMTIMIVIPPDLLPQKAVLSENMVTVGLILAFYGCIAQAVRNMKSEEERKKAISTCSSHCLMVFMFHGTVAILLYTDPKSIFSSQNGKFFTFFYTVVTALLNPLIYTLMNQEIQDTWLRLLVKWVNPWKSR